MLTKTQNKIMKIFVSKINDRFSIKQISEILKKPYPLIHRSIKLLIKEGFLLKDDKNFIYLNYKENFQTLAYIEFLRYNEFIKDKTLKLFIKDVLEKINKEFFVFLLFGSCVESKEPRDIDVLLIIQDKKRINKIEKILSNIASNFSKKFDINIISFESANEMFAKRDNINIMNETLNKHLILFGGEIYYNILKNARQ
jgi:predicted transcriptional regulator